MNGTYYRSAVSLTCLVNRRVEDSEERVGLLVLSDLSSLICLYSSAVTQQFSEFIALCFRRFFCFYFLSLRSLFYFRSGSRELAVDLCEHRQQLGSLVGLPELQVSRSLEQFTNTFRLFDTRKLDQDTTRLSEFLDVRLNNTETVDTGTEHVERVLDSTVHLFADHFLYLSVGRGEGHFVLQLKSREDRSQLTVRIYFVVRLDEERHEVCTAGFLFLLGKRQSCFVVRRLVMTAQCIEDVRNGYLHCYVHTALEVQTKVDLFLTALFERVAKPYFLRCNRVQIDVLFCIISGCILLSFLVIMTRYQRERQIESAHECKADSHNSNKSFVLHNFLYLFIYNICIVFRVYASAYSRTTHKKCAKLQKIFDIRKKKVKKLVYL